MTVEIHRVVLQQISALLDVTFGLTDEDEIAVFFDGLGWDLEALAPPSLQRLINAAKGVAGSAFTLREQLDKPNLSIGEVAAALAQLAQHVPAIIKAISQQQFAADIPAATPAKLAEDVGNLLLTGFLHSKLPRVSLALELLGIIVRADLPEIRAGDGRLLRRGSRVSQFDFSALKHLVTEPMGYLKTRYFADAQGNWRAATEIADLLGPVLAQGLNDAGMAAVYGVEPGILVQLTPAEQVAAQRMLLLEIDLPTAEPVADARLLLALSDGFLATDGPALVFAINGDLELSQTIGAGVLELDVTGATTPLALTRNGVRTADGRAGAGDLLAKLDYTLAPKDESAFRFGSDQGTNFTIGAIGAQLALSIGGDLDITARVSFKDVALSIQGGDGDGFLDKVLPKDPIRVKGDFSLGWTLLKGISLQGDVTFKQRLAADIVLGPIDVLELTVMAGATDKGLSVALVGSLKLAIGPVVATVAGLGISVQLRPTPSPDAGSVSSGNLGPAQLDIGFQPPSGIVLKVDASVVKGGGGLDINVERQQYSGFLQLAIQNTIDIKAIGILNARLPDGRPGYSLLLIITGEFPPIQLGLGFTLNGIGGLIGINRTAAVDVLRSGLHTGALNSILFPPDPLSNVPALLNTLGSVFPVAEGRYVFGPMAKFGWGSPTILTLDLALILEIPDPIRLLVLGRLKATLPNEKDAVVLLHLDALGVLDFSRSEFSLDATLYDSRILTFPLSGDMAMRLSWGAQPNFLFSVGGFHPHFQPPAGMPKLARLAIVFVDSAEMRLRFDTYFALTSNTVQFGARAEAYLKLGIVEARGFVSFDALFHFSPFTVEAELAAAVAIAVGGVVLLGADLALTLTGPTPWHLFGEANFVVLGIKGTAPVDLRIGDSDPPPEQLPDPVDVFAMLKAALSDSRNWQTQLPDPSTFAVSLRPPTVGETAVGAPMLAHPLGTISVRQRVVPLMLAIRRYGNAPIQGASFFSAGFLLIDRDHPEGTGTPLDSEMVKEQFALAQYENLSDEQKLVGPSFSAQPAGFLVADTTFGSSPKVSIPPAGAFDGLQRVPVTALRSTDLSSPSRHGRVEWFISMGAAATSPSRTTGAARYFAAAPPTRQPGASVHG